MTSLGCGGCAARVPIAWHPLSFGRSDMRQGAITNLRYMLTKEFHLQRLHLSRCMNHDMLVLTLVSILRGSLGPPHPRSLSIGQDLAICISMLLLRPEQLNGLTMC